MRGFAPYGCDPKEKLSSEEARAAQEQMCGWLPNHIKSQIKPNQPFALNHQLAFRVEGGRYMCDKIVTLWNDKIASDGFKISNKTVRASTEISEERRQLCRNFFEALEWTKQKGIGDDKIMACTKGLRLYKQSTKELIGETPRGAERWRWDIELCKTIGLEFSHGNEDDDDPMP